MEFPTHTETTTPTAAGLRTFDIALSPDHIIQISVTQLARETCPGEIHASDDLLPCHQPVKDTDLTAALTQLLASRS